MKTMIVQGRRLAILPRCGGAVVLAVASSATAETVLNFDELGLPDDTVITDQYAEEGVIFSAPGGDALLVTATSPIFPPEPQGLYSPFFQEPLVADIADGASMVGVWIDFNGVGTGMKIEAFDGSGGTGQLLGSDSTTSETFISVSAMIIRIPPTLGPRRNGRCAGSRCGGFHSCRWRVIMRPSETRGA